MDVTDLELLQRLKSRLSHPVAQRLVVVEKLKRHFSKVLDVITLLSGRADLWTGGPFQINVLERSSSPQGELGSLIIEGVDQINHCRLASSYDGGLAK